MSEKLYSVIIPAYNCEDKVERCIESVINQKALNLIKEIIIVNDGSSDKTKEVIDNYVKKSEFSDLFKVFNKDNGGAASARNMALSKASAEWIALLDCDDEWLPDKINFQTSIIRGNPEIDFLGGEISDTSVRLITRKIKHLYKISIYDLMIKTFPQTSTFIFKRKIYDEMGGYDEDGISAEDGLFLFKCCLNYRIYYHPKKVVIYDGGAKASYGASGLTGDLKGMYEGERRNYEYLNRAMKLNIVFYSFLRLYIHIKYLIRVFRVKMRPT